MTKREQYLENGSLVKTIMMLVIVAFHSIANWGIPDWFLNRSKLIPVVSVLAEWMSSFHTREGKTSISSICFCFNTLVHTRGGIYIR